MTSSNNDLDLALSTLAAPNVASEEHGMIWRVTARLTLIGLLMMGTAIRTRVSNAESLKTESPVDDYMSDANNHVMHRRLLDKDQTLLLFLSESSFARKKITDLIIHRYTATLPSEIESDGLDNAIEAIELLETDGEPMQVSGHPFLYVGSVGSSLNLGALRRNGITHVINWSTSAKCNEFADIEYMCFTGIRGPDIQGHLAELDKAVELVESIRKSGGRVLSHCWYGKNRSVTLLVAYLMKYEEMSATQANDLIKKTRPQAAPYFDTLNAYSERYISGNTENATKIKETKAKTTLNNDANH